MSGFKLEEDFDPSGMKVLAEADEKIMLVGLIGSTGPLVWDFKVIVFVLTTPIVNTTLQQECDKERSVEVVTKANSPRHGEELEVTKIK